jgi:chromosome segregation ATPase
MEEAAKPLEKANFQIFGSVDLDDKGRVKSAYPSWYFDPLKDELQNEVDRLEGQISQDRIPRSELQLAKERLKQKRDKLLNLDNAALELRGKQKDKVSDIRAELGEKIKDAMFTRDDMKKGLADAREEMRRMTEPCIELRGEALRLAQACNVKNVKGKVTRDGAAKVWKIISKALGERSNIESLRRD